MARVSRVQGDLGSGQQDESAQGDRRLSADRESAARRRLRAASAAHAFRSFPTTADRSAKATLRCVGLGECRKHDCGIDVPELHGDARGRAQHARPRAHAVRAAAGRSGARRLEGRARQAVRSTCACPARRASRSARPTSTSPPIAPSFCRTTTRAGAVRSTRTRSAWSIAGCGSRRSRRRLANAASQARRASPRPSSALLHLAPERQLPRLAAVEHSGSGRDSSGVRTVGRHRGGRASRRPAPTWSLWVDTFNNYFHPETSQAALEVLQAAGYSTSSIPRSDVVLRPSAVRLRSARSREAVSATDHGRARRARSMPACRWSCSSRAARRCSATSCAICSRPMRARPDCAARRFCCPSSSNPAAGPISRLVSTGRCCSTAIAIRRR